MDVGRLINELIQREGGYVNHPSDRGGATMYGITEARARAEGYKGGMASLPRALAFDIYEEDYWLNPGFDKVSTRFAKLAEELFDTGVNMGPKTAARFLQRALNAFNGRGSLFSDIKVDGDIGKMTVYALDSFIQKRGKVAAETVLLRLCDALQAVKYLEIAENDNRQEDFMFGWMMNRVGVA